MWLILLFVSFSYGSIAAYWGQNAGGSQQSLSSYCTSNKADIIILSFMNDFPQISLNFANQCSSTFSDGLLHCPTIGNDIKTCQSLGKTILLSLGGATGNYGFSSDSQASQFASTLWNKFGEGTDSERPFDDAVIDGFDFDIENKAQTGYVQLANELRSLFSSGSKKYYVSAAPQCPYPDESVGDLMDQVDLDFAFIQFYNNYCSLDKQFNWNTWQSYANGKNIKLYMGLAGSSSSAGSGYVGLATAQKALSDIKGTANFGGVSLWDISSTPDSFIQGLKSSLAGSGSSNANQNPSASIQLTSQSTAPQSNTPQLTTSQVVSSPQVSQVLSQTTNLFTPTTLTQSLITKSTQSQTTTLQTSRANFFDWLFGLQPTSNVASLLTIPEQTTYVTLTTTVYLY